MKVLCPLVFAATVVLCGSAYTPAQDAPNNAPKVIQIMREWIKPGKAGMAHDRSEAAFVQAFRRAKLSTHYVALNSMSGKSRALYIVPYDSFDAVEQGLKAQAASAAFAADYEKASVADGEMLDSIDQGLFVESAELSYHSWGSLQNARYLEISAYTLKPGCGREWMKAVKEVQQAEDKAGSSAHWATYSLAYGGNADTWLVLSGRKNMAEIDQGILEGAKINAALGEDGANKLDEFSKACMAEVTHNIYQVNPRQSYVDDAWIKADPDFWKPRTAPSMAAKPAQATPAPAPAKHSSH